jgi:hypothetical protein
LKIYPAIFSIKCGCSVAGTAGFIFMASGIPMAYIGIGYSGVQKEFLREQVSLHSAWLKGDRVPRFYGDGFVVLYDSNTAREFARKCREAAEKNAVTVYPMERPVP